MTPPLPALLLGLLVPLIATPVRVGFVKRPGEALRVGLSVGPVRRQAALSLAFSGRAPALRLASGRSERLIPIVRKRKPETDIKPFKRAALYLLKRFHADRLDVLVNVDTGDAAGTAILAALVSASLDALAAVKPHLPLRRQVSCSFAQAGAVSAAGIFSARLGHIMLAALIAGRDCLFGRIRTWTSTPSKTS